jgi:hypothetical protein
MKNKILIVLLALSASIELFPQTVRRARELIELNDQDAAAAEIRALEKARISPTTIRALQQAWERKFGRIFPSEAVLRTEETTAETMAGVTAKRLREREQRIAQLETTNLELQATLQRALDDVKAFADLQSSIETRDLEKQAQLLLAEKDREIERLRNDMAAGALEFRKALNDKNEIIEGLKKANQESSKAKLKAEQDRAQAEATIQRLNEAASKKAKEIADLRDELKKTQEAQPAEGVSKERFNEYRTKVENLEFELAKYTVPTTFEPTTESIKALSTALDKIAVAAKENEAAAKELRTTLLFGAQEIQKVLNPTEEPIRIGK